MVNKTSWNFSEFRVITKRTMRWKLVVLLFCAVALLGRTIPARAEEGGDDDVTSETDVESASENVEEETESVVVPQEEKTEVVAAAADGDDAGDDDGEDTRVDEDAVEVDPQAGAAKAEGKKGRYLNYDYYSSNLDSYDPNYNWEGRWGSCRSLLSMLT